MGSAPIIRDVDRLFGEQFGAGIDARNATPEQVDQFKEAHPHNGPGMIPGLILSVLGSVLAPYLAPMLAGSLGTSTAVARTLIAGAGGAAGGATNGGIKGALLGGLTSGLGYGIGDKLTGALNQGALNSGLSGYTSAMGSGIDPLLHVPTIATGSLGPSVSELVVNGALPAVSAGGVAGAAAGGALNSVLNKPGGSQQPGTAEPPTLEELTVMPDPATGMVGPVNPGALIPGMVKDEFGTRIPDSEIHTQEELNHDVRNDLGAADRTQLVTSTLGQVGGSLAGANVTGALAQILGLGPSMPNVDGGMQVGDDMPSMPAPPPPILAGGTTTPGVGVTIGGPTGSGAPGSGGGGGSGAAAPLLSTGSVAAAPAIGGLGAGDAALQGSTAPDIYPWRKLSEAA